MPSTSPLRMPPPEPDAVDQAARAVPSALAAVLAVERHRLTAAAVVRRARPPRHYRLTAEVTGAVHQAVLAVAASEGGSVSRTVELLVTAALVRLAQEPGAQRAAHWDAPGGRLLEPLKAAVTARRRPARSGGRSGRGRRQ